MSENASARGRFRCPVVREEGEQPPEGSGTPSPPPAVAGRGHHVPRDDGSENSAGPAPRRRGTHRRATGGSAPDAERALGGAEWGDAARGLGADAPDPRENGAAAGHEQWLREQRPPHWG